MNACRVASVTSGEPDFDNFADITLTEPEKNYNKPRGMKNIKSLDVLTIIVTC